MDRPYFARQLNGPIITNILEAIYRFFYIKCGFRRLFDYFNSITIENSEKYQLNFIGSLMGLQRFSVRGVDTSDKSSLSFTADYDEQTVYPEKIGFSDEYMKQDPENPIYGKFANGYAGAGEVLPIPEPEFRQLLLTISKYGDFLSMKSLVALIKTGLNGSADFRIEKSTKANDSYIVKTGKTILPVIQLQLNIILSSIYAEYIQFNIESMEGD